MPPAAVRPGPTRCSRTTPSSASACGWRSIATRRGRATWCGGWPAVHRRRRWPTGCSRRGRVTRGRDRGTARARGRAAERARGPRRSRRGAAVAWPRTRWCRRACGSSAATGGPTTSASAASTTCWRSASRSTSSCSTPRSTRTPAGSSRRRRRSAPRPSSPPPARGPARRTSAPWPCAYGHVYVAQVACGAKDTQTVKAFVEAEAHPGPSLIIAYSPCIAHGYDLAHGLDQQKLAVDSGYWPLYRFDPRRATAGERAAGPRLRRAEGRARAVHPQRDALPAGRAAGSGAGARADAAGPGRHPHPVRDARRSGAARGSAGAGRRAEGARRRGALTWTSRPPTSDCRWRTRSSPARRRSSTTWTWSAGSRTPAPRRSRCTRCSRSSSPWTPRRRGTPLEAQAYSHPEAESYFPLAGRLRARARRVSRADPSHQGGGPGARDRVAERRDRRRLDWLRAPDRAGWRRRPRAEHVCRRRQPDRERRRSSSGGCST